jgi:adenylate cyclase
MHMSATYKRWAGVIETAEERVERRLSAILAADIAGYSALMGADEARTVRDLKGHQAIVLPMVGEFGGRVIDTAGDGILAEFKSVVNAVQCAVAIQAKIAERNVSIEPACRMQLRIGINIGDVIYDDSRIYGDGINVATRLESIAEPGGICISGKVYDEIESRINLAYQDIGEQQLKNIARPVRVYRIPLGAAPAGGSRPALALPDKPSIAVLPFQNMSGDPEQDYFSDGVTEDLITDLSKISALFVIARHSSFVYRQVGQGAGDRARPRRAIRARGQHPQGRKSRAHHGAAHRSGHRRASLGRSVGPRSHRRVLDAGRGGGEDRRLGCDQADPA